MVAGRKLPSDDVLAGYAEQGMSNREIGNLYGTSSEAVRQALVRAGISKPERPSHARYLPWRIRADHVGHTLARRLRAYSKRVQGRHLAEGEARLLEEWLAFMDGGNRWGLPMSVHYDRNDPQGFWLEPRQPGDRDYISPPQGAELAEAK